jgi:hypothetical protein
VSVIENGISVSFAKELMGKSAFATYGNSESVVE